MGTGSQIQNTVNNILLQASHAGVQLSVCAVLHYTISWDTLYVFTSISYVNQVHLTVGEQCLMRAPDTTIVKPEPGHGRMSLQDRNFIPVPPVDISMGTLDTHRPVSTV